MPRIPGSGPSSPSTNSQTTAADGFLQEVSGVSTEGRGDLLEHRAPGTPAACSAQIGWLYKPRSLCLLFRMIPQCFSVSCFLRSPASCLVFCSCLLLMIRRGNYRQIPPRWRMSKDGQLPPPASSCSISWALPTSTILTGSLRPRLMPRILGSGPSSPSANSQTTAADGFLQEVSGVSTEGRGDLLEHRAPGTPAACSAQIGWLYKPRSLCLLFRMIPQCFSVSCFLRSPASCLVFCSCLLLMIRRGNYRQIPPRWRMSKDGQLPPPASSCSISWALPTSTILTGSLRPRLMPRILGSGPSSPSANSQTTAADGFLQEVSG
ncbi:uncharacterized protein LOC121963079 [Plectropomus leopardus]|uniref:uncharacterized protein LOC121963079 n=1 Tax=Plectropomus leopardus TaxID=160734 RepID=UPI001C4C4408|nr:uncharacterized protein LOC121963079 [Plectropomus leopardus]